MTWRQLVTGARVGRLDSEHWFEWIVSEYGEPLIWIAGGADGVDTQCRKWCERTRRPFQEFPLSEDDWKMFGRDRAGSIRNGVMVEFVNEIPEGRCLGLPAPTSRGTYNCIKQAFRAKLKVDVK